MARKRPNLKNEVKAKPDRIKNDWEQRPEHGKYAKSFSADKGYKKAYNDPSWYAKSEQTLKDSASFPYNLATGSRIGFSYYDYLKKGIALQSADFAPGIMTIDIIPHMGITDGSADDPVNVAAASIYSFVVHGNSRNTTYNRADLMLAIGAADSVFCFINWVQRLYGIITNPNQWNRYSAADFIRANGVSFTDLEKHIENLRGWLNQFINKASAIWVPNSLPLLEKHSWMFSNIYKDHENPNAQFYMFVPKGFYVYDETSSESGGFLKLDTSINSTNGLNTPVVDDNLTTYAQIVAYGNNMLQAILDSEDIGTIFADIRMAYTANGLFKLVTIDESYRIDPTYNTEVMMEITNSFSCALSDEPSIVGTFNITQNPDNLNLVFRPMTQVIHGGYLTNKYINMEMDNPSPSDTMVATRLTNSFVEEEVGGGFIRVKYLSAGTEVVAGYRIYTKGNVEADPNDRSVKLYHTELFDSFVGLDVHGGNVQSAFKQFNLLRLCAAFDWHPTLYVGYYDSNVLSTNHQVPPFTFMGVCTDMNNAVVLTDEELRLMDETAIMSEFNVPIN